MANTIKLGYSNTSGQTPDTLAGGEVAINTSNRKVWVGNGTGNTLVFNHTDYAPASANASQTYVNSRGFLTAVSGMSYFNNYSHPTGAGNNHIPSGGTTNQFLKWSSSGVATWAYDNTGVFSITAGYGLGGGTINGVGTITHSIATGFSHIPPYGSTGYFLQYSGSGQAAWVSGVAIAEAARTDMGVAPGPSGTPGLTDVNFTSTLKTKLDGITAGATVNTNLTDTQVRSKFTGGVGIAMDSSGVLSTALHELGDHTPGLFPPTDEFIILANGSQKRKLATEIFGNHAFGAVNTTTSSTSTTQAASASSVKAAYDLAASKSDAPNNAEANVGVQLNGAFNGLQMGGGYISHILGTPWNHIPANGASGQLLGYSAAGTAQWVSLNTTTSSTSTTTAASASSVKAAYDRDWTYNLPTASNTVLGGVKAGGYTSSGTNYCVKIDGDRQLYVTVPSSGTTTWNGLENISNLTALP